MKEQWRDIEGFPGYQVSSAGHVRSFKRFTGSKWVISDNPRTLSPSDNGRGYLSLSIRADGKDNRVYIHRLVAEAFIRPFAANEEVGHKDGNKRNNTVVNLYICSHKKNMMDYHFSKTGALSEQDIVNMRKDAEDGISFRELAECYGRTSSSIRKICYGISFPNVGGPIFEPGVERPYNGSYLTYDEADEIRDRCASGESQKSLAEEFELHYSTISRIVSGELYSRPLV